MGKKKRPSADEDTEVDTTTSEYVSTTSESDPDWSLSDDGLLRGMKTADDGPSWSEIDGTLRRHKGESKARWKIIKDRDPQYPSDEEDKSGVDTSESDEADKARKKKLRKKERRVEEEKTARKMKERKAVAKKTKDKEARRRKKKKRPISSSSSEDEDEDEDEETSQATYLATEVWPRLYDMKLTISPRPDYDGFSANDCAILAGLDAKYKGDRWLQMKAGFFNLTGRMVDEEMIRAKIEEAEEGG